MGYRTIIARYVAKWGIAQMCLCETKYQRGVSHHFGGVLTSLKKYRAIWGIAAIVRYGATKGPIKNKGIEGSSRRIQRECNGVTVAETESSYRPKKKKSLI